MKNTTISLNDIPSEDCARIVTGLNQLDDFLDGGFVPGQCVLLGAEPGSGKSTSTMQIMARFADLGHKVLFFSGEESLSQIKIRANRLGANRANVFCTEDLELNSMLRTIKEIDPKLIIVDSLPKMYDNTIKSPAGSGKQNKVTIIKFTQAVKKANRISIIIGHSNKGQALAGALALQHEVDTTLYMKVINHMRVLTVIKNRFGPDSNELPLTMTEKGFNELQFGSVGSVMQEVKIKEYIRRLEKQEEEESFTRRIFGKRLFYDFTVKFAK